MFDLFSNFFRNYSTIQLNKLAEKIGNFLFRFFPYRKSVIKNNIQIFLNYNQQDQFSADQLVKKNYRHIASLFLEGFKLQHVDESEFKNYISFDKDSKLFEELKSEKSAVILLAHLGNWEFLATGLGILLDEPIYFVTKKLTSHSANQYMHKMREQFSNRMIPMEYSREVLNQKLSEGKKIGLAGDQSANVESYWGNFLGVKVPIFLGAASFALKNNVPLFELFPIRQSDGRFIIYGEKIKSDDLDRNQKESLYILTDRHTRVLEKYISKYPDQYYWIHKRWKHADKAHLYSK